MDKNRDKQKQIFFVILFAIVIIIFHFFLWYGLFQNQLFSDYGYTSDLRAHINLVREGSARYFHILALNYIFSPFQHMGYDTGNIYILALTFAVLFMAFSTYYALQKYSPSGMNAYISIIFTVMLMWVSMLYLRPLYPFRYLGKFSPNIWHNSTSIFAKPFSILSFVFFADFIKNQNNNKYLFLASVFTALSCIMKVNFVLAFLPAVLVYILFMHNKNVKLYLKTFIVVLPTLFIIFAAYLLNKEFTDGFSVIIDFLGLWGLYAGNRLIIPYLIFMSMAFPIAVLTFRYKNIIHNNLHLLLAWIAMITAIFQFALFAESGESYEYGNFIWGLHIVSKVLFIFSLVEILKWWEELAIFAMKNDLKWLDLFRSSVKHQFIKILIASVLFILHFICGVGYLNNILKGGLYL